MTAQRDAVLALGRLPAGSMNKTEAAYDQHLTELTLAGDVLWHKFEAVKLRLADSTFYTPDFAVIAADGVMEMHEVKGHWQDDARVKIKVAAATYPFRFCAVKAEAKKRGGGWIVEKFGADGEPAAAPPCGITLSHANALHLAGAMDRIRARNPHIETDAQALHLLAGALMDVDQPHTESRRQAADIIAAIADGFGRAA